MGETPLLTGFLLLWSCPGILSPILAFAWGKSHKNLELAMLVRYLDQYLDFSQWASLPRHSFLKRYLISGSPWISCMYIHTYLQIKQFEQAMTVSSSMITVATFDLKSLNLQKAFSLPVPPNSWGEPFFSPSNPCSKPALAGYTPDWELLPRLSHLGKHRLLSCGLLCSRPGGEENMQPAT